MNINGSVTVLFLPFMDFQCLELITLGTFFFFFLRNIQLLGDFLLEYLGYQVLASTNNVFLWSSLREDIRVVKEKSFLVNGILLIKEIVWVW